MKRLLVLVAAAVALAMIVGGWALFHGSAITQADGPFTITMSSYPGNPPSGVTGTTTIQDIAAGPITGGQATVNGIASFPYSAVFYFTTKNCDLNHVEAVLVYHHGATDQNFFLTDGVQFGALDGSTILINTLTGTATNVGAAAILSASVMTLPNYPNYRNVDRQYLACGNVDGSAVTGWEGLLDDQHRLRSAQPLPPCFDNLGYPRICLQIDMDPTNGTGPCNPVDATATRTVGSTYKVAVCLTNSDYSPNGEPASWTFKLVYDDTLNQCVPAPCESGACLDANPDANVGTTSFSTPDLGMGADWHCGPIAGPSCDIDGASGPGHGRAFIGCTSGGTPTLPTGPGVSAPLAEVAFKALAGGTDNLALDTVDIGNPDNLIILACPGGPPGGGCFGGTDIKVTPTPTRRPGVGGIVNLPPASAVASDSDAPSDGSGWPVATYAALAGASAAAVIVLGAGGWYVRRRRLSQR